MVRTNARKWKHNLLLLMKMCENVPPCSIVVFPLKRNDFKLLELEALMAASSLEQLNKSASGHKIALLALFHYIWP